MTVAFAAEMWGLSDTAVSNYCQKGMIPGARKIMRPEWSHPRWQIPDDAIKPKTKRGRKKLFPDAEEPVETQCSANGIAKMELPDPKGVPPVQYVWENQDNPISLLAKTMGISNREVVALYEAGFQKYI